MLETDNLNAAQVQEAIFQDSRVSHYWDGKRVFGQLVSQTLNLATPIAWDVYMLYSPGASWEPEQMPAPDIWMHQLDERVDRYLDPKVLSGEIQKALKTCFPLDKY